MKLKQWVKQHKVASVVILFLLLNLFVPMLPEKKQATYQQCHAIYTEGDWWQLWWRPSIQEKYETCEITLGCYPVLSQNPGSVDKIIDWFAGWQGAASSLYVDCTSAAEIGNYVVASSSDEGCQSGVSKIVGEYKDGNVYKCIEPTEEELAQVCTHPTQKQIASLIPLDIGCKSRYYIALGFGAVMFIMLIGVVL